MNPFEFVIAIIFLVFAFRLIAHRLGMDTSAMRPPWSRNPVIMQDDREAQRLREEVRQLQERLKVLERITVEKENSLSREIEQLRDRS